MESKKANKVNIESTPSVEPEVAAQEAVQTPFILAKIAMESYIGPDGEMRSNFTCDGSGDIVREAFGNLLYQIMKHDVASADDIISIVPELNARILEDKGRRVQ